MTELSSLLVAIARPIADAALSRPAPAIGAAAGYIAPAAIITPRRAVALLRAIAADISALDALGAEAQAARLAAYCAVLADAVRAATDIAYESRQEADAMRAALDADLAGAMDMAADAALALPGAGGALWSAIAQLRAQLARDLHEVVGRLPSVLTVRPPMGISVWLLAQHYAGDDPRSVIAMHGDIVTRNRLPHPGTVLTDTIEVLP
ncbi:hypothetical protein [Pararhodobacter sp.]|uniref:hypothetical protein n=1 Tax=Pararhodobacter sp. TaxID=2127056 RepID=UPI002AFE6120|nr:hypothetical protein [Pararhodobacter sp.]